jgi:putative DNA primase/helicase
MRLDFFTYIPQFKLLAAGNQLPPLDAIDEATRRRLQIIPFRVQIPATQRDPLLIEKLLEEANGIFAWMLEGCLAWQRQGLDPPAIVRDLSTEYLDGQDMVGRFLEDCCELDADHLVGSSALFKAWTGWASRHAEPHGSQRALIQELQLRGFAPRRTSRERVLRGLRLKAGATQ